MREYPEKRFASCGHSYCDDCKTKRGRNRGNRRFRHTTKAATRRLLKLDPKES